MRPLGRVQRIRKGGYEEKYLVVACLQLGQDVCHDGRKYWPGHLNIASTLVEIKNATPI